MVLQRVSRLVFVDECKSGPEYLLTAVTIDAKDATAVRVALNAHRRKGQNRIHFTSESPGTRGSVLTTLAKLPMTVTIYGTQPKKPEREARNRCLLSLILDVATLGEPTELHIESDGAQDVNDRTELYRYVREARAEQTLRYQHLQPHQDAGLWIADAVGWSWRRGDQWKRKVKPYTVYKTV